MTPKRTETATVAAMPDTLELLVRDAVWVLEHEDAAGTARWASEIQSVFRPSGFPPEAPTTPRMVLDGLVGQPVVPAMLVATAIATFGPPSARPRANATVVRLRQRLDGDEPLVIAGLGRIEPGRTALLSDRYGDGYGIYLEYELDGQVASIGVYVNVNLGRIATEVLDGPPLDEIAKKVATDPELTLADIDPAAARALVTAAFERLDETFDPPVDEFLHDLRALAEHHFALLPAGGHPEPDLEPLGDDERDRLIESFLASTHAVGLPGDAEDIARTLCDFADYRDGDPLRWSPTVVEILLADWLPRKVLADPEWFANVAPVLRAWVRFAGDHRDLSGDLVEDTLAAVDHWTREIHDGQGDPSQWGPGKQIARQLTAAGINLHDRDAVGRFIDDYNASLPPVPDIGARPEVNEEWVVDLDAAEKRLLERWEHFDARVAELVRNLLAEHRHLAPPDDFSELAGRVRDGLRAGRWPYDELVTLADLSPEETDRLDDVELLIAVAGAWIEPDTGHDDRIDIDPDAIEMAHALDHLDWTKLVIAAVRQGPGTELTPTAIAEWIVESSDDPDGDPDNDPDAIEAAIELLAPTWRAIGITDHADRLTAAGAWLLPRALLADLGHDFDTT